MLVVTLSVIGIPIPAVAGEEPITVNGVPLAQLLRYTAVGDPLPLAEGQISA